jgi:hypothetical protein
MPTVGRRTDVSTRTLPHASEILPSYRCDTLERHHLWDLARCVHCTPLVLSMNTA